MALELPVRILREGRRMGLLPRLGRFAPCIELKMKLVDGVSREG